MHVTLSRGAATLALLLAATSTAAAQMPRGGGGPASIKPDDIHHRLSVIADDSMMGRDTPSPGLEMTAKYVADQFKAAGLKPGGENGTWFQRYPIYLKKINTAESDIGFMQGGKDIHVSFTDNAAHWFGKRSSEAHGPAYLIGGKLDADAIGKLPLDGKVVLLAIDFSTRLDQRGLFAVYNAKPAAIVAISNRTPDEWASRVSRQARPRTSLESEADGDGVAMVEVREEAIKEVLSSAGIDPAASRTGSTMIAREVPGLTIGLHLSETLVSQESAPNTIGILEGSDPKLKSEYVVFSAHMDHIGIRPGQPDSIANGADDDGSGTTGVMELAQAFGKAPSRPKRSILFITVSGEEKGLWGSQYFSEHPTVPIENIVADLNIDMIGRNWADTIVAIGKEHSDLGKTLNRINGQHPELGMTAIDDIWPDERFYFRSDHFNFARKGVPILFFFNGVHDDYHRVSDELPKINTEKMSRILKLLYYLGEDVANTQARPAWNPESYKEIVQGS